LAGVGFLDEALKDVSDLVMTLGGLVEADERLHDVDVGGVDGPGVVKGLDGVIEALKLVVGLAELGVGDEALAVIV
jgi:hypothetical protein